MWRAFSYLSWTRGFCPELGTFLLLLEKGLPCSCVGRWFCVWCGLRGGFCFLGTVSIKKKTHFFVLSQQGQQRLCKPPGCLSSLGGSDKGRASDSSLSRLSTVSEADPELHYPRLQKEAYMRESPGFASLYDVAASLSKILQFLLPSSLVNFLGEPARAPHHRWPQGGARRASSFHLFFHANLFQVLLGEPERPSKKTRGSSIRAFSRLGEGAGRGRVKSYCLILLFILKSVIGANGL